MAITSCEKNETDSFPSVECERSVVSFSKSKYNIILIIGQSNTHAGLGLDASIDTTRQGVMQLGRVGDRNLKVVKAIAPLDHHTAKLDRIGFGLTFANLFKNRLVAENDSVIIIPCGHGGTGFSDNMWNKGDALYNDAVSRVKYVQDKFQNSELQAILWHQGEIDVHNKSYERQLGNFINDIREDLNAENVPFILGGMVPYWVSQDKSRLNQQKKIAGIKDKLCIIGYADPSSPVVIEKENNKIDEIHFDADGQRELGKRYFNEYLNLIELIPNQ
ncbi:sialate O-acetylesterase [Muricauda sp. CAU 1633]|uniref:sialate O-acetylesterase n=1 Tax=Allomuricauda sp. CAU 1633 TaxID=2816036 RepID=UPI001A8F611C|nr:sialate O-acetylesterase [Muricauda sp. CAU 1633]MBO0320963.1 sialate O-acetylesterase [Muricauda sp. CAU 1633]